MILLLLFLGVLTTVALSDAQSSDGSSCPNGWSGRKCDMPTCSPYCQGDQVCLSPNNCGCLKSGTGGSTNCPYSQCSSGERLDCYPGTCDDTGSSCRCPSQYGFTGKNCLNITTTPEIRTCTVEVYSTPQKTLLQKGNCSDSGYNNSVFWINSASIGDIRVNWQPWYDNGPALPGNPPVNYLSTPPVTIGVTKAGVVITLLEAGQNYSANCAGARERSDPPTAVNCDFTTNWQTIGFPAFVQHNQKFRVTVSAQLGGQKQVTGATQPQQFTGTPITQSTTFGIDLRPPVHCLSNNTDSAACPYFAIYLDQDIRTNPRIEPRFYNWTDDGSGIANFNVKIFKMSSVNGQLVNAGGTLYQDDVDPIKNDCFFILNTESGVYSIELIVYDLAGNTAKARKLFIYNKDSNLHIDPGNPVYLKEANPSTNYTWLTNFENPRDGSNIPLTVTWANHFISSAQFSGEWGYPAKPWPSSDGIDDKYGTRYGRRSIEAIQPLQNGIAYYAVAYVLDPSGGGKGLSPPSWVFLSSGNVSYQLPIKQSLSDGYTIVVWVQATDAAYGTVTEKLVIGVGQKPVNTVTLPQQFTSTDEALGTVTEKLVTGVDRTPPISKQQSFELSTGGFNTKICVIVTAVDGKSDIENITYRVVSSELSLRLEVDYPPKKDPTAIWSKRERQFISTTDQSMGGWTDAEKVVIALGILLLVILTSIFVILVRIYEAMKTVSRSVHNVGQPFPKRLGNIYGNEYGYHGRPQEF